MNTDLPFKNTNEALNYHVLNVERNNVLSDTLIVKERFRFPIMWVAATMSNRANTIIRPLIISRIIQR